MCAEAQGALSALRAEHAARCDASGIKKMRESAFFSLAPRLTFSF